MCVCVCVFFFFYFFHQLPQQLATKQLPKMSMVDDSASCERVLTTTHSHVVFYVDVSSSIFVARVSHNWKYLSFEQYM